MEDGSFSFTYGPTQRYEKDEVIKGKQDHLFGLEDWGGTDSPCSEFLFYQENMAEKGVSLSKDQQQQKRQQLPLQQHQQPISNYCALDDFRFSDISPPIQPIQESTKLKNIQTRNSDFVQPNKQRSYPFSLTSLEILSNYRSGLKKLKGGKVSNLSNEIDMGGRKFSTEEIMRVAGERYIEFSAKRDIVDFSMLMHLFGFSHSGLSEEERQDIDLAQLLLAAAEKVGYQQFDRASRLLTHCEWIASDTGNPVQRIVYYFGRALRERIDIETGRIESKRLEEKGRNEMIWGLGSTNLTFIACHQKIPFTQVTQFTGIQAVIESVASVNKIHLIDLGIRSGVQWTVLMQALSETDECSIKQLKITAVGTTDKQTIEETGKRLKSFAKSVNLNFSFKVVFVSDMKDLKEEHFEIEADAVVAVYSTLVLWTMLSRPSCLETLMRVIRKLNPSIMVVTEVEANNNSPSFVNRFIEGLFYYSAYFDCLEARMDRNSQNRMTVEANLGELIRTIAAAEGEERDVRHVKIDVWRAFFARFGMVETEFSESSLYQASLVVKQFVCGNSCTLDINGKSLIVGWKGTPILSLSVWKFS